VRILVVSTHDNRGGAAKAAYRFAREFIKQGNEVCMYVKDKILEDSFIRQSTKGKLIGKFLHLLDFLPGFILSGFNKEVPFTLGLFGEGFGSIVEEFKPDIINIHWTWKGFVSFPQICRISRKIPVVWTMHDCSPFSGGLFLRDKENFLVKWLNKINLKIRKFFLKDADITFVSPSEFLLNEFNKSSLSENFKGLVINNGVDVNIFKKEDKNEARGKFGLRADKKYILFGAVNLVKDPVKGGKILMEILKDIEKYLIENNIGLVSFGSQNPFKRLNLDSSIETKFLGFVQTDESMSEVLSLGDVVLVPSLYENYPFAVLEPLSCGIPVVAFNTGGISEIIKQKENGYLSGFPDKEDYINGVKFCLNNTFKFMNGEYSISAKSEEYLLLFNNCLKTSLG
jgi:glycosyltransferase involved in cell wall biosynthesis